MKSKKLKRLKRYDLGGNLGTTGITNDNVNKPHIYLDAAGRTLAGVAEGFGSIIGLDGVIRAGNERMGVQDQLNSSKEYQNAKGISAGALGTVAGAFTGGMLGKKNSSVAEPTESPDTNMVDSGYATPEGGPNDGSVQVDGLQNAGVDVWNARGGRLYPNGGTLPTYDELNAWNDYLKGLNSDLTTQGFQPTYLDDKANFGYAENYFKTFAANNPSLKNVKYNDFVKKMQTYGNDVYMSNNNATKNKQMFQQNTQGNTANTATNPWGRSNPDGVVGSYTLQQYIPTYNVNHSSNTGSVSGDVKAMYNPYDQTNPYAVVSNTLQNNGQPVTNQQLMDHWNGKTKLDFQSAPANNNTQVVQKNEPSDFGGYSDDYLKNSTIPTVKSNTTPVNSVNTNTNTNPNVSQTDINNINQSTMNNGSTNTSENNIQDVQALWEVKDGKLVNTNAQKMYGRDESYTISPQTQKKTYQGTRLNTGTQKYGMGENGEVYLIQADGGNMNMKSKGQNMLTEFNAGGTHEMNPLGGVPVGNGNMVEQDETKFTPNDKNQPEFVFSEREKMSNGAVKEFNLPSNYKGRSLSSISKSIKNKYKMRPHDGMAKEAMDKELTKLADVQEIQKQRKAESLMAKAQELAPDMFQQPNAQQMQMPQGLPMGEEMMMAFGGKMLAHGGTDPVKKLYVGPQLQDQERPPYTLYPNLNTYADQNSVNTADANIPTVNDLYVGPQLQDQQNKNQDNTVFNGDTKIDPTTNPSGTGNGSDTWNPRKLFETNAPKDFTGAKAGMFGLQALGELGRLGMMPDPKLTGHVQFDRVNPYTQQLIAEQQANQQRANYMNALRNSGANQSQYLAALTSGLGDMNIGNTIAGINAQGQMTNAGIQSQEAQINKNIDMAMNDLVDQGKANRSNQMGAVGAGLVQNMSGVLTDTAKKDMDMFSLPFVATKENYQLKYNPETGKYEYYYTPPTGMEEKGKKAYGGKLKNLKKYGGKC